MIDQSSHNQVDNNVIEIALLKNNVIIFDRVDKAIETNGAKITKAVNDKTDNFIGQITTIATEVGANSVKILTMESKLSGLWAKIVGIQAVLSVVFGFLGYLVGGGHIGH